jgi:uncharacterized protein (DUF305 family)
MAASWVAASVARGSPPTAADVRFMSGMIVHHAQAVLIAGWAPSHGASSTVRLLCERIDVSQRDDIALMQQWLRKHHELVPDAMAMHKDPIPGVHAERLMPGMLTASQLAALDSAQGAAFDRLFLTLMIQHHEGALTMVKDLFATPGGAQDAFVFQFATGVNADQSAEIDRMRRMLAALPAGDHRP